MVAENQDAPDGQIASLPSSASSSHSWKQRIFIPTLLAERARKYCFLFMYIIPLGIFGAGIVGAGTGLVSNHRKTLGLANVSANYAANFAIVTGCYCGAREFVSATRKTGPDDLWNSAIAGFGTGALLGRLQGGQLGAARYSVIFAFVGTAADFAFLKLKPVLRDYTNSLDQKDEHPPKKGSWLRLPEWFPIQILDEEALAAKRAREEEFLAQRARIRSLKKEES